jgi:hypothetical protein
MYYTEVHPEETEPEEADDDVSNSSQESLREVIALCSFIGYTLI